MAAPSTLTFKELQDLVLDQLQELQAMPDMTLVKIKKYINLGYKDFTRRTRILTDDFGITTVADQASYEIINAGFYHIGHVRYIEDSDTEYGEPLKLYPGGFAGLPRTKEFGIPCYYWVRYSGDNTAHELGTFPICSTADMTITVWGYSVPLSMTADADVPIIHAAYHETLMLFPIWKICNSYAHKSKEIRQKGIAARDEYLEAVEMTKMENSSLTNDDIETIDIYDNFGEY